MKYLGYPEQACGEDGESFAQRNRYALALELPLPVVAGDRMSLRHARQGDVLAEDDAPGIVLVDAYPGLSVSFGLRHYDAAGVGARLHLAWKTKPVRQWGVGRRHVGGGSFQPSDVGRGGKITTKYPKYSKIFNLFRRNGI